MKAFGKKTSCWGWLLTGALLLPALAVQAQGVFNMGTLTNTLSIPTESGKAPARRPAASQTVLRYVPTVAQQQQTVQAYVARLKPTDPKAAQAVATTFGPGKTSYGQLYRETLAGSGFQDNDVASALGLYLELGYRIAHNIEDDKVVTPTQERGLRAQVAQILTQTGALTTPAAAARLGEEMKLQTVVLAVGWLQARKGSQLGTFRTTTTQQFKTTYGFDFQQIKLTDSGFSKG